MEEQKIDESVNQLLRQRLRILELVIILILHLCFLIWMSFIKENFWLQLPFSCPPPSDAPEELLLPCFKTLCGVDEGQYPREYPDAIEGISFGSYVGIGK